MNMLADDDGTFPRVSELSIRLEQEKNIQKIDNYSKEVHNQVLQERKRIAAERDKLMNLEVTEDSGFNQNANPDMFYSMPDHEVFKGVIISTNSRAAADKKFDNFAYDSYKEQTDLEKKMCSQKQQDQTLRKEDQNFFYSRTKSTDQTE